MEAIRKQFITNENNEPTAVVIDLETYNKIEDILEDFALGKYMNEVESDKSLNLKDAKAFYKNLRND